MLRDVYSGKRVYGLSGLTLARIEILGSERSLRVGSWKDEIGFYGTFWPVGPVEFRWEVARHVPVRWDEDFLLSFANYARRFVANYIIEFIAVMGVCGNSFGLRGDKVELLERLGLLLGL